MQQQCLCHCACSPPVIPTQTNNAMSFGQIIVPTVAVHEQSPDGHRALRQRTGLVGANRVHRTERLDHRQPPHHRALTRHLPRAQRQREHQHDRRRRSCSFCPRSTCWRIIGWNGGVMERNLIIHGAEMASQRFEQFQSDLPLEFFHFLRSFTLLIGFALVTSAINISRRKRRAFHLVLALSALSVVAHLLKGRDYEQALLSLVLIGLLWRARRDFTVRSHPPDWRWAMIHLTAA